MLGCIAFNILVYLISTCSAIDDLPSYFPKCFLNDPDLDGCVVKATEDLREYMKKGVPELDIPSVDPLIVPEIISEQGTSALNYKIKLTNATVKGLSGYKFTQFHFDTKAYTLHGTADFKGLSIESEYDIDGKILVAPVNGKGIVKAYIDTGVGDLVIKGGLVNRKGEEYFRTSDIKAKIVLGKTRATFDGSFGNNEQISRATSDLLKEHSDEIINDFKPAIEKVIEAVMFRIMNGITKIPYKILFPPQ